MDWFDKIKLELEEIDRVYFSQFKRSVEKSIREEVKLPIKEEKIPKVKLKSEKQSSKIKLDFLKLNSTSPWAVFLRVFFLFLLVFGGIIGIFLVLLLFLRA
ncbi:MAG: hypothetical protein QXD62_01740 [Candidatus Woesearchaeota archaeon]